MMRYFKYKNTDENPNYALKEQYKTLTENEKLTVRKEKLWSRFSIIVSLIIYICCMIAGIHLLILIPRPNNEFLNTLVILGKVITGFLLLIVSGIITAALTKPLWNKVASFNLPYMKKEILSKSCSHLRDYYELQAPYIITKCFDATDKKFKNHDVCIFIVDDELRITTDLIKGFLYGERDLGCYAFKREEIIVSKLQVGKQLIAELKVDDHVFLLGYRAKRFIEKEFVEGK